MTNKQQEVLKLYLNGMKPVDIQHAMEFKYLNSVIQIINALKVKGLIPIKNDKNKGYNDQGHDNG